MDVASVSDKEQDGLMIPSTYVCGVVWCVHGVVLPVLWCDCSGNGVKTCVCEVV